MDQRFVFIKGTGTIGAPLIGICSRLREEFGLSAVAFAKKQPHQKNLAEIEKMQELGALLAVEEESRRAFVDAGYKPDMLVEDARHRASVIIDCTPKKGGLTHKKLHYDDLVASGSCLRAIAQGSEEGFGPPFAEGINNHLLTPGNKFIQAVSCNTQWAASVVYSMTEGRIEEVEDGDFVYGRRSGDVSQEDGQQNDVSVDEHKDDDCGTHQARDVGRVFQTLGHEDVPLFSSTSIVPSQLMHVTRAKIVLRGRLCEEETKKHPERTREILRAEIIRRLTASPLIGLTYKRRTGTTFSIGRDYSENGRILTPAIVSVPTIWVGYRGDSTVIVLWGFTSQDGNSLRSSIAAMLSALYPEEWHRLMRHLAPYMFKKL